MPGNLSARRRILAVLVGGFFGAFTRYLLSQAIQSWSGKAWPYDILLINLTGAFVLAFVSTLADAAFLIGPTRRLLINTGFLGAYTTFSTLALGDILLLSKGAWIPALIYLLVSICGGIVAVLLGDWLAQQTIRYLHRAPAATENALELREPGGHLDIQDDLAFPAKIDESGSPIP